NTLRCNALAAGRRPRVSWRVAELEDRESADGCPGADGSLTRVSHGFRRTRHRTAAAVADRRGPMAADRTTPLPGTGQTVGQGDRADLCSGGGIRYGALLRARPALAAFHGAFRCNHRIGVHAGRVRLL